ncbi:MAG: HAD family hydrolase [Vicinamibacteria bacterium]|nr:HAD family hydrolase [Vicinamibacteria bacterium]
MNTPLRAFIFDLYGTLLCIARRHVPRDVPRLLGVAPGRWVGLVRDELFTRSFADATELVAYVCERLQPQAQAALRARLVQLFEDEIASVAVIDGVRPMLAFLRRRGMKLGLLSNLVSVYKAKVAALGLLESFDEHAFSCEAGLSKPDERIYTDLCARLQTAMDATIMVGDAPGNDVAVPRRLGMRARLITAAPSADRHMTAADAGWLAFDGPRAGEPLIADGERVRLGEVLGRLWRLRPVRDEIQGRYNLVAAAEFEDDQGRLRPVFVKRFLFPEAAHVEEFAHRLNSAVSLPSCEAGVTRGEEPCLVTTPAAGSKLNVEITPRIAFGIGQQGALAYIFANADLRPRNAFLDESGERARLTMIDLEHCFFNLAYEVAGLIDPYRPQAIDDLDPQERAARLRTSVLTPRATRRARRSFFDTDSLDSPLALAFKEGWLDAYARVRGARNVVADMIGERVYREPYLIIGTQAHRRAMARVDLADILARVDEDPIRAWVAAF